MTQEQSAPFVKVAWTLIICLVIGVAYAQTLFNSSSEGKSEDMAGLVLTKIQAEYLLGVSELLGANREVAAQANILDIGTVDQRLRYIAFMLFLQDKEAAKQGALRLSTDLESKHIDPTEAQHEVQEQLDILIRGEKIPDKKNTLIAQLDWFGELLEAPQERKDELIRSAKNKILIVGTIFVGICAFGCFGFIGAILVFIKAGSGKIQTGMLAPKLRHGIYAEVFVLWLILFALLQGCAGILADFVLLQHLPFAKMSLTLVVFFLSLFSLVWARIRGIYWREIKDDIGWTAGSGYAKEICYGIAGYGMMLPFLVAGVFGTILLAFLQQLFLSEGDSFQGTGGGAHPIFLEIAESNWDVRILLFTLAAIAAPIVEETMFRGVLYRQLRSSLKNWGLALNILLSVLLTSFIFAAIHPQGWIAIPALMGIAIGMNLMREWRGTVIPSMVVHGISNGLVTSIMLIFLS